MPERTCVVCRRKGDKSEVIRFVLSDTELTLDLLGVLPGRGCYLHQGCLAAKGSLVKVYYSLRVKAGGAEKPRETRSLGEMFIAAHKLLELNPNSSRKRLAEANLRKLERVFQESSDKNTEKKIRL